MKLENLVFLDLGQDFSLFMVKLCSKLGLFSGLDKVLKFDYCQKI